MLYEVITVAEARERVNRELKLKPGYSYNFV